MLLSVFLYSYMINNFVLLKSLRDYPSCNANTIIEKKNKKRAGLMSSGGVVKNGFHKLAPADVIYRRC